LDSDNDSGELDCLLCVLSLTHTRLDRTGPDRTQLDWTALDWTTHNLVGVQCTASVFNPLFLPVQSRLVQYHPIQSGSLSVVFTTCLMRFIYAETNVHQDDKKLSYR